MTKLQKTLDEFLRRAVADHRLEPARIKESGRKPRYGFCCWRGRGIRMPWAIPAALYYRLPSVSRPRRLATVNGHGPRLTFRLCGETHNEALSALVGVAAKLRGFKSNTY